MATNVQYHLNKTQGEEHTLACVKCAGKTAHKVLASVDERGEEGNPNYDFRWATDNQVVQCLGCKTISFRIASSNSEDYHQIDDEGNFEHSVAESLFPSRIEGLKGFGEEVIYLPTNVRRVYAETLMAMSNNAPVLAGIGLRALLETVCKEKNAVGTDLLKKIDSLVSSGFLLPREPLFFTRFEPSVMLRRMRSSRIVLSS